jgi:hypothetical protein
MYTPLFLFAERGIQNVIITISLISLPLPHFRQDKIPSIVDGPFIQQFVSERNPFILKHL